MCVCVLYRPLAVCALVATLAACCIIMIKIGVDTAYTTSCYTKANSTGALQYAWEHSYTLIIIMLPFRVQAKLQH